MGIDRATYGTRVYLAIVAPLSANVAQVATGDTHALVRLTSGDTGSWGSNLSGELGAGATGGVSEDPVYVTGFSSSGTLRASAVAAGADVSCLVTTTGAVKCWGDAYGGVLGSTLIDRATPGDTPIMSGATDVTLGAYHACAVVSGAVQCWGTNTYWQCGVGTGTPTYNPVTVPNVSNAVRVVAGREYTCAVSSTGVLTCWGRSNFGQAGPSSGNWQPTVIPLPAAVSAVAAGDNHTCALLTTGAVYCWGANSSGQLGDNTKVLRLVPTRTVSQ